MLYDRRLIENELHNNDGRKGVRSLFRAVTRTYLFKENSKMDTYNVINNKHNIIYCNGGKMEKEKNLSKMNMMLKISWLIFCISLLINLALCLTIIIAYLIMGI